MKVLIVEDDANMLCRLVGLVGALGHDVLGVCNRPLARERLGEFDPDFVLLDVTLKSESSLCLLADLRRECPDAFIAMMVEEGEEDEAVKAMRLGANTYLRKPIRSAALEALATRCAALLGGMPHGPAPRGRVARREFTIQFDNDVQKIPEIANSLASGSGYEQEDLSVRQGIMELLMNAVEHGNLGITTAEKEDALNRKGRLAKLYAERLGQPERAARKVTVSFRADEEGSREWTITDEGDGFDWHAVLARAQDPGADHLCGRGVLLSRLVFDEIEYAGRGNTVRVLKRAGSTRSSPGG